MKEHSGNMNHEPAGSSKGGQFTFGDGSVFTKAARKGAGLPSERNKSLSEIEKRLAGKSTEAGVIIDENGNIVQEIQGDADKVALSSDTLKAMENNTFTHNHPNEGSLSPADLTNFVYSNAAEFRAVSVNGKDVFVITRPEEGWGSPSKRVGLMLRVRDASNKFLQQQANSGIEDVLKEKPLFDALEKMNVEMAKKFGWIYHVERGNN